MNEQKATPEQQKAWAERHGISPPEQFVYWMLKDLGFINAFTQLAIYEARIAADPEILKRARRGEWEEE